MMVRLLVVALLGSLGFSGMAQEKPKADAQFVQGSWDWDPAAKQSDARPVVLLERIVIKGDTLTFHYKMDGKKFTTPTEFKLNAQTQEIDFTPTDKDNANKGKTYLGLYELKEGKLKICYRGPESTRPKNFRDIQDGTDGTTFIVLKPTPKK